MAALEGAEAARSTATGMAAVTTALMGLVKAGDHVVAAKALFGSCRWVIEEWLPRFGVTSTLVDGTDLDAWKKAVQKNTKALLHGNADQSDAGGLSTSRRSPISRTRPAPSWWSTMCSPRRFTRARSRSAPTAWSIRRPSTSTARAACSAASSWHRKNSSWITYHQVIRQTGPSLSPFNAWVLLKGLETLSVRVQRQTETAGAVSSALDGHKKISRLIYPGRRRPSAGRRHRQADEAPARRLFVRGQRRQGRRLPLPQCLQLIGITNNLGDAKSLVTHPTTTTHQRLTPEQRAELGIGDGLVRFSAGLEHPDDLIEDLLTALDAV